MAVYTPLSLEDASVWFDHSYQLGTLQTIKGINSGIENSNFFISASNQGQVTEFVLTIFERLSQQELLYYLELMQYLANQGLQVPKPIQDRQGQLIQVLKGKPATVVTKLEGSPIAEPKTPHCQAVGQALAKMHLAGQNYKNVQINLRGLHWWQQTVPEILPFVQPEQAKLLLGELQAQEVFFASSEYSKLPQGPSHCDLFRDNVLFKQTSSVELSGFFDFYFAGTDKWLFDLAVTVNDWCIDQASGELQQNLTSALLKAYQSIRPFQAAEISAWTMMLRAAALRFWISRLWDFYLPRNAQLLTAHDPQHFERILRLRILNHAN